MNIVIWMLAGCALGWLAYSSLGLSEGRGKLASIIIGAVGGLIGGKLIAPMFTAPALVPGDFSMSALFFAAAVAAAFLAAGNFVHNRWDV